MQLFSIMGALHARESEEEAVVSAELGSTGERLVRTSFFRISTHRAAPVLPTLDVFGLRLAVPAAESLAAWFGAAAKARGRDPKVMHFANDASLLRAMHDADHRALLGKADAVLGHGRSLETYARLKGHYASVSNEVVATLRVLFAKAEPAEPLRVYFVGPCADRAAQLASLYPGVRVVGATDRLASLEDINEACPDVVLVGGEHATKWVVENASLLDVGVVASVGDALFALAGVLIVPERVGFFARVAFVMRTLVLVLFGPPPLRPAGSSPPIR